MKKFWTKTGKFFSLLLATCAAFSACTDDNEDFRQSANKALDIQVAVKPTSRAMVMGTALPEGAQIGVNVTATDGSEYDGQNVGYLNVPYTATGTGTSQTWGSTAPVMLSGTEGLMYAYFPYTQGIDYTAVAVDIADQHDWMYGTEAYTVSDKAPSADVVLEHAQTALNINVIRDDAYTGAGEVTALAVTSEGLASEGTLDTRDGSWSAVDGANAAISIISAPFTLDGTTLTNQENPYMFVPASAETKDFTVSATVDGKAYNVGVAMNEAFAPGKMYKLNVNITNTGLTVSQVTLTDWVIDTTLPDAEFEPVQSDTQEPYADWVKLTYNVTDISQPTQIFFNEQDDIIFDIANVASMAVLEDDGSRAASEPQVVTPAYQYTFSSTGEHTVYVKFTDKTRIPKYAFAMCLSLSDIEFPQAVKVIDECAFYGCTGLTSLTIGGGVQIIEKGAFAICSSLQTLTISGTVKVIKGDVVEGQAMGAFMGCFSLTTLMIEEGVETIEFAAFAVCAALTEVTIPKSVSTIGKGLFYGCFSLESLTVESGNAVYDSRNNCNAIMETATNTLIVGGKYTEIPQDCEVIGKYAFATNEGLTGTLTLPSSVTTIEEAAFDSCRRLTGIVLDENMETIGEGAFQGCEELTSITSLAMTAPSIQSSTFNNIKSRGTLYVPAGATGYDEWLSQLSGWTIQEITE